tara:strand:- start:2392 stop:3393 length:1002 start_codon:yes stop_codon:yes gene_type:complete
MGQTLKIYKDLAENLSDSGYAVLRYDELTISCPNFSGAFNYENVFLPAMSALDYLKSRSDIDTNNLILMGHSEGAQLISYMASIRDDIKATISLAGARTPFDSILAYQTVYIAKTCGKDTSQAKNQAQQILNYFDIVRKGNYTSSTPSFGGVAPAVWHKYITVADSVAILYQQNSLPSLFVGFGSDINVPLSELDRFEQSLSGDFTFNRIAGLNHYMTTAMHPKVSRIVADTIVYWLRNRTIGQLEPLSTQAQIFCYPNPFKDKLYLELPVAQGQALKVKIYKLTGELLWVDDREIQEPGSSVCLDLPELAPGVYIVSCMYDGLPAYFRITKH